MVKEASDRRLSEKFHAVVGARGGVYAVKELVHKGADVNAALDGVTPLMQAALHGNADIAAWLIAQGGAEADAMDATGRTALYVAIEKKSLPVITALVICGANPDLPGPGGQSPREFAAANGQNGVLYAIDDALHEGARQKISNCIVDRKLEALQEVLATGAMKDFEKAPIGTATPLMLAINNSFPRGLELLLKAGAKAETVNEDGNTPLCYAIDHCPEKPRFTEMLLKYGARPDTPAHNKHYPLHLAVQRGVAENVKLLLAAKADTEVRNSAGETAVYSAAKLGRTKMIPLLAAAGAKLNALSGEGRVPLAAAIMEARRGAFDALLSCGADPEARSANDATPLMYAARHGEGEMLAVLLALGVGLDARRLDGWTALHLAAMRGMTHTAEMLLDAGAEYNIPNRQGQTALHVAHEFGRYDIIRLIDGKMGAELSAGLRAPQVVKKPLRFVSPGARNG